ncbi:TetR/AcrR family transcriptional regulator (plasmid) [Georgenia sp. TF02-10]|uniref:TetR/AcrR family transcriptional regulator n=1 Tax=Georgenia sp. TF02-10 TaxID=2917725 RepID=UPI001FA81716|nr:TetR/AcrR family transcriptional regulator [Georgenia sp. TF02-10]UNX56602.1 TetR/AcrR family transcriptional regulator [Georgenia sp. TF02-10]
MTAARRDARQTDTAERILHVATELFFVTGYPGTSVRQIMRACDVSAASMYNHFTSKEEVLYAILVRSLEDSLSSLRVASATADRDAEAQLRALVRAISTFHSERQLEGLVSQTEWRYLPPARAADVLALQREVRALFEECLSRGVESGEFALGAAGVDVEVAAKSILDLCINAGKWFRPHGRLGSADIARQHVELVACLVGAGRAGGRRAGDASGSSAIGGEPVR